MRSLGAAFKDLPEVSLVKVPVQAPKENAVFEIDLEVIFPHDILAHYGQKSVEFEKLFGSDQEIQAFWRQKDLKDPAFVRHPAIHQAGFKQKCIPLRMHSDNVEMSKAESLHVVSWSSFFCKGPVQETQQLFTALVKSAAWTDPEGVRPGTMDEIYGALQWSVAACMEGLHPAQDWKGNAWPAGSVRAKLSRTPLHPDGKTMAMMQICGDLEELANQYGLAHWGSSEPCFLCAANTSTTPWSDLSPQAQWRKTVLKPEAVNAPPSDHKLWTLPGLTRWSVGWDVLHGLDLGPNLLVLGSCLEDLVQIKALGRSMDERCRRLWARAQAVYKEKGIANRLSRLEVSMWRAPGEYPKLRCKGNEARHFLPVVEQLLAEHDRSQSEYTATRSKMIKALLDFYTVLEAKDQFLTPEAVQLGKVSGLAFFKEYMQLAPLGQITWGFEVVGHSQIPLHGPCPGAAGVQQCEVGLHI